MGCFGTASGEHTSSFRYRLSSAITSTHASINCEKSGDARAYNTKPRTTFVISNYLRRFQWRFIITPRNCDIIVRYMKTQFVYRAVIIRRQCCNNGDINFAETPSNPTHRGARSKRFATSSRVLSADSSVEKREDPHPRHYRSSDISLQHLHQTREEETNVFLSLSLTLWEQRNRHLQIIRQEQTGMADTCVCVCVCFCVCLCVNEWGEGPADIWIAREHIDGAPYDRRDYRYARKRLTSPSPRAFHRTRLARRVP